MAESDLEKGLEINRSIDDAQQPHFLSITSNGESRKHHNELEVFQNLLGIHFLAPGGGPNPDTSRQIKPANPLFDIFMPSKAASKRFRNRGLYDRALTQDLLNRSMYTIARYMVILLYFLQIVIAATFTALSAAKSSSKTTLTALGAINTVIAGMTAWLTGQNMPVRFRRARNQYREVVKAIESAERMFAEIDYLNGPRLDPVKERDRLEQMYEEARLDQEANYPETQHEPATERHAKKNAELRAKAEKRKAEKKAQKEEMKRELERLRERAGAAG